MHGLRTPIVDIMVLNIPTKITLFFSQYFGSGGTSELRDESFESSVLIIMREAKHTVYNY